MKESVKSEEIFFHEIMAQSKLEVPFPDFEDNVMLQIEKENSFQRSVSKDVKLSWLFFVAGSVFGIIISLILPRMQTLIFGIEPQKLAIFFQMIFVLLLFTQLETLLRFIKKSDS
jgi:hypothetical protein